MPALEAAFALYAAGVVVTLFWCGARHGALCCFQRPALLLRSAGIVGGGSGGGGKVGSDVEHGRHL
eukprot:CAMPEP_0197603404 /NCGR_PEP_ID=MMETSP1326-20131121/39154_1 /TAXON_ID=1155430 /ORGANISM="Genus nov. species nov., Strain RCC2288" /LENGTH=65 /DNA_ID=CAMNT_0043170905 /DNA_START=94 /DNA_END=291 /DNA_ORIENTATION=+